MWKSKVKLGMALLIIATSLSLQACGAKPAATTSTSSTSTTFPASLNFQTPAAVQ